jgi:hypothetical protein
MLPGDITGSPLGAWATCSWQGSSLPLWMTPATVSTVLAMVACDILPRAIWSIRLIAASSSVKGPVYTLAESSRTTQAGDAVYGDLTDGWCSTTFKVPQFRPNSQRRRLSCLMGSAPHLPISTSSLPEPGILHPSDCSRPVTSPSRSPKREVA